MEKIKNNVVVIIGIISCISLLFDISNNCTIGEFILWVVSKIVALTILFICFMMYKPEEIEEDFE